MLLGRRLAADRSARVSEFRSRATTRGARGGLKLTSQRCAGDKECWSLYLREAAEQASELSGGTSNSLIGGQAKRDRQRVETLERRGKDQV